LVWIDSLLIAFSIYTIIPVPQRRWDTINMGYVFAFLPAAGAATAFLSLTAAGLASLAGMGEMVRAALATAGPIVFTGGIHFDGFIDTVDALSSRRDMERKLEIMKDPHVGAFAVTGSSIYMMLYFALSYEAGSRALLLMIPAAVLSRALCALTALILKSARKGGMLDTVVSASDRAVLYFILCGTGIAAAAALMLMGGLSGAAAVAAALLTLIAFVRMAKRQFGGMTGDLAGFFIQLSELMMLLCMAAVK
jgi:adenosylcobinamide-GDP ribazoletransferase